MDQRSDGDATFNRKKPLLIHLITFHKEKPVFEGDLQTTVLKKKHEIVIS